MEIAVAVLAGFATAAVAPGIHRLTPRATGWVLALFPLSVFSYFLQFVGTLPPEGIVQRCAWAPSLGLNLSFLLDGLSLLFTLIISGIGALVLIYAGSYLRGHAQLGRLFAFLLLFMASMLGLVLADNLLALFVFWELTSLSSYFLIGFNHEQKPARAAALQALLVTGGGGLALLAGLLLLGQAASDLGVEPGRTFEISTLLPLGAALHGHALYLPILVLILVGAYTKSAQFPFHFWLPSAMEAPTPISAYLHSATMVKAGIYLLARLLPILGGSDAWRWLVLPFGTVTMLFGAILAIQETDLKRILAYSTVSALGALTLLLGLGSLTAIGAAMTFLLAHALYKGSLFLVAGAIDHETGTREVEDLGGLGRKMPLTGFVAGLAALSMAGLPPFFGFIGKELLFEATAESPVRLVLSIASVLTGMLVLAAAGVVGLRPFVGTLRATPKPPHEAPLSMCLGPALLAGIGLALGLYPAWVDGRLLAPAVAAILPVAGPAKLDLALWHGWTAALALSGISLVGGLALFARRAALRQFLPRYTVYGPAQLYELALDGLSAFARWQTQVLQNGYLRYYLLILLLTTIGLVGATLVRGNLLVLPTNWSDIRLHEASLAALITLATLATVLSRSRLAAIAALGVVGYGVALIFVLYGAPDLAMTQFLIETLTVILFVLVFYHLPAASDVSRRRIRIRDAAVAIAGGGIMTALVLVAGRINLHPTVSSYYSENAVIAAHGRNVVNVILVDFRGLDTLGEITVLAVAAIGVFALLKLRPQRPEADPATTPLAEEESIP